MDERLAPQQGSAHLRPGEVEIRTLASSNHVSAIRAMAADLAMREDLDLDTISDLRLAIEEACATVLASADPNGMLVCRLLVSATRLEITAHVPLPAVGEPTVEPFSLRILRTLADTVDYWTSRSASVRLFNVQLTTVMGGDTDE